MKDLFAALLQGTCQAMALALQDIGTGAARVERDADGLPIAWQLFPFGITKLTKGGEEGTGTFTEAMADSIVAFHTAKGMPVPIDAEHALGYLSMLTGVEETELAKAVIGSKLAVGFGELAKRPDGLWLTDVDWTDVGRALLTTGSFRYHSPVLRGGKDGSYRVTSDTLSNNAAMNNLEPLLAEADTMERSILLLSDLTGAKPPTKEQPIMDQLLVLLGALFGRSEAIALSDGAPPADVMQSLTALVEELPKLRANQTGGDAFLLAARSALALGADADLNAVQGALLGIVEKATAADGLQAQVATLMLESETRNLAELTTQGLADGKLTDAVVKSDWFKSQDATMLDAFLKAAPKVVPLGTPIDTTKLPKDDAIVLTAEDHEYQKTMGYTDEQMLRVKKEAAE